MNEVESLQQRLAETDVLLRRHLRRARRLAAKYNQQFAQAGSSREAAQALRAYDRLNEEAARHRFAGLIPNP